MCGILFAKSGAITREHFEKALSLMKHRGPDATGVVPLPNGVFLGHNRLSIIDPDERSNQPFFSTDGTFVIIFNGEIYNFNELSKQYHIKTRTGSDTEVLLELYRRFGSRCLEKLNGIFAFIIYHLGTGKIFAARDRLGVKPLYKYEKNGTFIFSSEINAIKELKLADKIDEMGLRQYRKLRTFFNGRTLYADISMFPAGSFYEDGKEVRYWQLPRTEKQDPPSDEELRDLIESSIRYRMVSDVPVGSYLSGGLDSTIVSLVSRTEHTWSVGTRDNNEFEFANIAAKQLGSKHHDVVYAADDFSEKAQWMINVRKEPLSVPNEVPLFLMSQEVKKHNTVILSGEGADELFFGYDRIFRHFSTQTTLDIKEFSRLYAYGSNDDYEIVQDALSPFMSYGSPLNVVASFFQVAHLHGLLRRLDNSTMMASVEAREPFVDYRLIERLVGVDITYRMAGDIVKAPLKRVFHDLVPQEIVARKKVGFPVKISESLPTSVPGQTDMDRWLNFNLMALNIDVEEVLQ